MEDFFNLISLKNSNHSSVVIGGNYHTIQKAVYPLLWKYSNERNRDIKLLLDACQNYSYSEMIFTRNFLASLINILLIMVELGFYERNIQRNLQNQDLPLFYLPQLF